MTLLTRLMAAAAVTAAVAAGAPAAVARTAIHTQTVPGAAAGFPGAPGSAVGGNVPLGGCIDATTNGQGRVGGTTSLSCAGAAGVSFVAPSSSVQAVTGPTISPAAPGVSIVAGGNVAIGP